MVTLGVRDGDADEVGDRLAENDLEALGEIDDDCDGSVESDAVGDGRVTVDVTDCD